MKLSEIGEFGLIKKFKNNIKLDASVIKGSGDDCAVVSFNKDKYMLLTCDMIVEGVDFYPKERPYLIGRKALAVSISDIAACAGVPKYALVSMGLPKRASVEYTERIVKGMLDLARKFKINIVGGDISKATKLVIDVSLLGFVEKKNLVLRSGAKTGDIIFVTGSLGGSIRGKHLRFLPRVKEARKLTANFKINSMIDISDGLAADLGHILQESKVGAMIFERMIPISKNASNLKDALYSGEDFELLFTVSKKEAKRLIKSRIAYAKPIGEIVEKKRGLILVNRNNLKKNIRPKGYKHF
jgi:thiamine-monophosphate kinase